VQGICEISSSSSSFFPGVEGSVACTPEQSTGCLSVTVPFLSGSLGWRFSSVFHADLRGESRDTDTCVVAATDSVTCYFADKYLYQTAFFPSPAGRSSSIAKTLTFPCSSPPVVSGRPSPVSCAAASPRPPPQAPLQVGALCPPPCRHRVERAVRPCGRRQSRARSAGQNVNRPTGTSCDASGQASRSSPRGNDHALYAGEP
jgi:hypothetical protein